MRAGRTSVLLNRFEQVGQIRSVFDLSQELVQLRVLVWKRPWKTLSYNNILKSEQDEKRLKEGSNYAILKYLENLNVKK